MSHSDDDSVAVASLSFEKLSDGEGKNNDSSVINDVALSGTESKDPTSDEPKSHEPKSEEPKSEEPKSEEPKLDEPTNDDSNDELIELRGAGRYFGAADAPTGIVCHKCKGRGHIAAQCPEVLCEVCGEKGTHQSRDCQKVQRCSNCGAFGHLRASCREREQHLHCVHCGSHIHRADTCPTTWRKYIIADKSAKRRRENVSCYNCGDRSHLGDDCVLPREYQLRFRENSAYCSSSFDPETRSRYESSLRSYRKRMSHMVNDYQNGYNTRNERSSKSSKRDKYLAKRKAQSARKVMTRKR